MANNTTFHSLTNVTPAYDTKRGKEFRAQVQGFAAKDAEVRAVGGRYVVSTFMNLSGAKDDLNTGLGLSLEESSYEAKNGIHTCRSQLTSAFGLTHKQRQMRLLLS